MTKPDLDRVTTGFLEPLAMAIWDLEVEDHKERAGQTGMPGFVQYADGDGEPMPLDEQDNADELRAWLRLRARRLLELSEIEESQPLPVNCRYNIAGQCRGIGRCECGLERALSGEEFRLAEGIAKSMAALREVMDRPSPGAESRLDGPAAPAPSPTATSGDGEADPTGGTVGGAIFIMHRDGCFLMEQRSDIGDLGENWFFPGGKIEDGEDRSDTLRREMAEELACIPNRSTPLHLVLRPVTGRSRYWMQPFLVTSWFGEPPPRSIDKGVPLRWIGVDLATASPVPVVREMAIDAKRELSSSAQVAQGSGEPKAITSLPSQADGDDRIDGTVREAIDVVLADLCGADILEEYTEKLEAVFIDSALRSSPVRAEMLEEEGVKGLIIGIDGPIPDVVNVNGEQFHPFRVVPGRSEQ